MLAPRLFVSEVSKPVKTELPDMEPPKLEPLVWESFVSQPPEFKTPRSEPLMLESLVLEPCVSEPEHAGLKRVETEPLKLELAVPEPLMLDQSSSVPPHTAGIEISNPGIFQIKTSSGKSGQIQCSVCEKKCNNITEYTHHLNMHSDISAEVRQTAECHSGNNSLDIKDSDQCLHQCLHCPCIYSFKDQLVSHLRQNHHWLLCLMCSAVFKSSEEMSNHHKTQHFAWKALCNEVSEKSVKGYKYFCVDCRNVMSGEEQMTSHLLTKCGRLTRMEMHECMKCTAKFKCRCSLFGHLQSHFIMSSSCHQESDNLPINNPTLWCGYCLRVFFPGQYHYCPNKTLHNTTSSTPGQPTSTWRRTREQSKSDQNNNGSQVNSEKSQDIDPDIGGYGSKESYPYGQIKIEPVKQIKTQMDEPNKKIKTSTKRVFPQDSGNVSNDDSKISRKYIKYRQSFCAFCNTEFSNLFLLHCHMNKHHQERSITQCTKPVNAQENDPKPVKVKMNDPKPTKVKVNVPKGIKTKVNHPKAVKDKINYLNPTETKVNDPKPCLKHAKAKANDPKPCHAKHAKHKMKDPFTCRLCHMVFLDTGRLQRHLQYKHKQNLEQHATRERCEREKFREMFLCLHNAIESYSRKNKEEYCSTGFVSRQYILDNAIKIVQNLKTVEKELKVEKQALLEQRRKLAMLYKDLRVHDYLNPEGKKSIKIETDDVLQNVPKVTVFPLGQIGEEQYLENCQSRIYHTRSLCPQVNLLDISLVSNFKIYSECEGVCQCVTVQSVTKLKKHGCWVIRNEYNVKIQYKK